MSVAIVYYSRTGNTNTLVDAIVNELKVVGLKADVYRVLPQKEYSKPLHLNPRLIFDTLIRKGTSIRLSTEDLDVSRYDLIVVASPIWINSLSPPIQQFLKNYAQRFKRYAVLTTSALNIDCRGIVNKIKRLTVVEPSLCVNVTVSIVRDSAKLQAIARRIVDRIAEMLMR